MAVSPPLTADEAARFALEVPEWQLLEGRPTRTFEFPDFKTALAWVNLVGALAESEGHHPDIHLSWGQVRLVLWTYKVTGLTENDFILAAKCDALAKRS